MSRLPDDFEFPRDGILDLWQKWNIGDSRRGIPPLADLTIMDYKFLDLKEKTDLSKRGSRGVHKNNRRESRKTYNDIKCVCAYIEEQATKGGMNTMNRRFSNVQAMFEMVAPELFQCVRANQRNAQLKWLTMVAALRKKLAEEKRARARAAAMADNKL